MSACQPDLFPPEKPPLQSWRDDPIKVQDWRDHLLMVTAQAEPHSQLVDGMDVRGARQRRNQNVSWNYSLRRYMPVRMAP